MSVHIARIEWTNSGPDFLHRRFSRAHRWLFDGGASVPASSSPHVVPLPWSSPEAVDPEEALVAAASSCHMLWFLHLAANAGLSVESYVDDAVGEMGKDSRGKVALTRITLNPVIRFSGRHPEVEELDQLHHAAHEECFIASSLRTEIVMGSSPSTDAVPRELSGKIDQQES